MFLDRAFFSQRYPAVNNTTPIRKNLKWRGKSLEKKTWRCAIPTWSVHLDYIFKNDFFRYFTTKKKTAIILFGSILRGITRRVPRVFSKSPPAPQRYAFCRVKKRVFGVTSAGIFYMPEKRGLHLGKRKEKHEK